MSNVTDKELWDWLSRKRVTIETPNSSGGSVRVLFGAPSPASGGPLTWDARAKIEAAFVKDTAPVFPPGTLVVDTSGKVYKVLHLARRTSDERLEYVYECTSTGVVWTRNAVLMEQDGKFQAVDKPASCRACSYFYGSSRCGCAYPNTTVTPGAVVCLFVGHDPDSGRPAWCPLDGPHKIRESV